MMALSSWQAVVAPRGLPPAVRQKAHEAFVQAINDPKVKERFSSIGFEIVKRRDRRARLTQEIPR